MRPRGLPERGRVASAWLFSIVGHAAALGLGGLLVAATLGRKPAGLPLAVNPPPARDLVAVDIELPTVIDGSKLLDPPPPPVLPSETLARGGGEAMPRLDSGRKGRGGADTSPTPAMNLADRDDDMLLSPEVMSRLDRNQIQRIRASKRRASREDWRASREPMELTFLAEGRKDIDPTRPEHRRLGSADPSAGAQEWGSVQRKGGSVGAGDTEPGAGERARQPGGPVEGSTHPSTGRGARDGARGEDHRDGALVAFARPMVNQGTPSVPADARDRPTDNVDSEQEVAARMQSILHASNAGGAPGRGVGGQAGPGAAGAGGRDGPGSASRALGTGVGPGLDVDPRDRRRNDYMRQVIGKLGPHTDWRKLMSLAQAVDGVQGVVVVTFTILSDGSVAGTSITRSCGVPDIDENVRRAIVKAAPFPPLPPELGTSFRWAFPLDLRNPAVRPRDGGAAAKPPAAP
jgi:TonB family protein